MDDSNIPIIGAPKPVEVQLEVPALFSVKLVFINHMGEYTSVDYALPPGVYPAEAWLEKLVEGTYRQSLKALKLSTKDLSWRKCTPHEFVKATSGGVEVKVAPKWSEAFASGKTLEIDLPEIEVEKST
jgi:hypothetical protein